MFHRLHIQAAACSLAAALSSSAHAAWTLAAADAPVAVISGTNLSTATAGTLLEDGDLLESHDGVVHVQDGRGTLVALGPHTRMILTGDAHVALLHGWLKLAGAKARIDTERGSFDMNEHAATIISAPDDADSIDVFSETGTQDYADTYIPDGHFGVLDAHAHLQVQQRPTQAFLTGMPVAFRDALQPFSTSLKPTTPPSHAVNYDDIAPWLQSTLPARKTFPARFRTRLSDPAFRRDIDAHLKTLPDWRALLHPPTRIVRKTRSSP